MVNKMKSFAILLLENKLLKLSKKGKLSGTAILRAGKAGMFRPWGKYIKEWAKYNKGKLRYPYINLKQELV